MAHLLSTRSVALVCVVASAAYLACGTTQDSTFNSSSSGSASSSGASSGAFPVGDGEGGLDNEGTKVSALVFDPTSQELIVDGTTSKSATFKLRATLPDGRVIEVAPESLQFDRPDLASAVNGNPVTLTTTGAFAGTGKLHGLYGGAEALADLTVKVVRRDVGAGIDPSIVAALDAANLPDDPSITELRYPYDKTVFPLGLTSPLIMWNRPTANDVYKLRLEETNYIYELYAVVTSIGQLRVDQAIWDRVTASNGGEPLKVTLSRYRVANTTAYKSASETWTIAPASLRGAIYYWTASQINGVRAGHIARLRPGSGAVPQAIGSGQSDPCMGCHAVSADGSTLAASVNAAPTQGPPATYAYTNGWMPNATEPGGRAWASFDLPAGTVRKQTKMQGSNLALTPDGKYAVFGGRAQTNTQEANNQWEAGSKYMTLADTATGTIVVDSGLDNLVLASAARGLAMPAFSPDGKKLATVEFDSDKSSIRDNVLPESTRILIFGFDQATLKFAPTPTALPLGTFTPYQPRGIGYPSFTPSTNFVAFHVGNHSTGCFDESPPENNIGNCDDATKHRGAIYYQASNGGSPPARLNALDDPPANIDRELSVEPTFNPIERGNYSWVVFTSMRDWGNKLTGAAVNGKRRLWVGAIDVATGAADPSHPPFYLEGQEDSPNMRGFWTLAACTATPAPGAGGGECAAGFECCSGFCDRGVCVDVSKIACVGLGGDCSEAAACCNSQSVSCVANKCKSRGVN
jgi:hypothetical protein